MTSSQKHIERFKCYLQKAVFSIKEINNKLIYNKLFLFEEKLMFYFEDVFKITLK